MSRLIVGGDLLLYGDVGDTWGDGSGFNAIDVVEALAAYGDGDITIRLNSGGGSVFEGVAIYNALLAHPGKVTTCVDSIAASAASVIAMAGNEIVMRPGSTMMIHEPHSMAMGTAADQQQSADVLEQLAEQMAAIYAVHTGLEPGAVRELMKTETWMTAEDAVAQGFATKLEAIEPERDDDMMTEDEDKRDEEATASSEEEQQEEARAETEEDEDEKMEEHDEDEKEAKAASKSAAPVARAGRKPMKPAAAAPDQTLRILNACRQAKLDATQIHAVVSKAGGSYNRAQGLIIDMLADRDPAPRAGTVPARVVADGRDKFVEGAIKGVGARAGIPGGERNEFSGMTLRELARMSLEKAGVKQQFSDPMTMVGAALNPQRMGISFNPRMAAGMHSTSDFAEILSNNANKSLMIGYEEAEESFSRWTSKGTLTDFKVATRLDIGLFPSLASVPEGAEYSYATTSERKATIQLATYGRMFSITRQAIINDDLSAFTRIPRNMGRASKRTVGNLVYALITSNANAPDGTALFHANHNNLKATGGGAPTVASVDAGRAAMALQSDPDDIATGGLNLRPAYFLVPVELEGTAKSLMASQYDPAGASLYSPNHVAGLAEVISDARLSTQSAVEWYLAASPTMTDTIEVAYLNGVETPTMEQRDGWEVDGIEYKVRLDAGVAILDYRGLYKNDGTA